MHTMIGTKRFEVKETNGRFFYWSRRAGRWLPVAKSKVVFGDDAAPGEAMKPNSRAFYAAAQALGRGLRPAPRGAVVLDFGDDVQRHASTLPAGWTESRPGALACNPDPVNRVRFAPWLWH